MTLVISRALRMRRIVICGLTGFAIFFHINDTIFQKS
jgi:hypothetical protein